MQDAITVRAVRTLKPGAILWDDGKGAVTGFYARRQKGTAVTFGLRYRLNGRVRWFKIGPWGSPWTPDTARAEAKRILAEVVDGKDVAEHRQLAREAITNSELADLYLEKAEAGLVLTKRGEPKRASTLAIDKGRIERHIKPAVGKLAFAATTSADVKRLRDLVAEGKIAARIKTKPRGLARVKGGRTAATRTVTLYSAICNWAISEGLRPDGVNPCRGVQLFADREKTRRISDDEYKALAAGLAKAAAEDIWPPALAAERFLLLTGWRSGEAIGLRWREVNLERRTATIDTKTGPSMRPLSHAAAGLIREMAKLRADEKDGEAFVFPSTKPPAAMAGFKKFWRKVVKLAELPADITPHTARHSFGSVAADLGFSEMSIAALLGHRRGSTTSGYVHFADAVLLAAGDRVADDIAARMGEGKGAGVVVEFPAAAAQ